jgi:hypothetical protein
LLLGFFYGITLTKKRINFKNKLLVCLPELNIFAGATKMSIENTISALGLLGLGGVIGTYLRIQWERRNASLLQNQEFKDTRYKCIIMLMYTALNFEKRGLNLNQFGRNFQSNDDVIDELKAEWHNAILFASEDALMSIYAFINQPSATAFKQSALAMRRDLWGGKMSDSLKTLEF